MIEIRKYRHTRHWAVYVDGELLAVVVYRKGAVAIADMLMRMRARKEAGDAARRIANCELRIANCELRIADCGLRIADCGLRIADCGLRIADCGLQIADCGLRIEEVCAYGLRIVAWTLRFATRVWISNWSAWPLPVRSPIRNPNSLDRMRPGHAFLGTTNLHVVAARL